MIVRVESNLFERLLQAFQLFLTSLGLATIGYCLFIVVGTWAFQQWHSRDFDTRVKRSAEAVSAAPIPGAVVGKLVIPRLGLSTIVVEGDDDVNLRKATGHIPGTALPGKSGNIGIAGHRDTFFRPLKDIRKRDELELVTLTGTARYRVSSTQIVNPSDIQVLKPTGKDTVTLVTCYPFYFVGSAPKRFIVRAERVSNPS